MQQVNIYPIYSVYFRSYFFLAIDETDDELIFLCCCFQAQAISSQAEKRQRAFDKSIDEWKRKVADLQVELENSQRESRANAAEVYKLRAQIEEVNEAMEALKRENKNLTGLHCAL